MKLKKKEMPREKKMEKNTGKQPIIQYLIGKERMLELVNEW